MKRQENITQGERLLERLMNQRTQPLSEESKAIIRLLPFSFLLVRPNADLTIVEASDEYLKATLTRRESIVGRPMFDIFPDNPADPLADGVENLRNSFNAVMQTKTTHVMAVQRYDVRARDNLSFLLKYWLPTNIPVLDELGDLAYIIHRVFDVTSFMGGDAGLRHTHASLPADFFQINQIAADTQQVVELLQEGEKRRRDAEARAQGAGELLDLAVEAAELGTFYCPLPLETIFWNATCKRHFFLPDDSEANFDLFYSRLHPDDRGRIRDAVNAAVFERKPYDAEYRVVAPDGRCRWLRAKGKAYYAPDGTPTRFDGITIDISAQKHAEEELRQASRQKDDFLAMLAHELRNPLAPISAAADLLRLPNSGQANVAQTSQIIARQVQHMSALLDDLLDVSRVTRGMVTLNEEVWDARLVVSAAIEQVKPIVDAKHHQLSAVLPSEAALVLGDEKRLVQIVVNLLTNAAKYTPDGGKIELRLDATLDEVSIQVIDSGIGMEPKFIPQAFALFVQGARTPERSQGGLGLGLALAKRLVELQNGEIAASSPGLGHGSTFTVRLPRHAQSDRLQGLPEGVLNITAPAQPISVMVVDDNVDAAKLVGELLGILGYHPFIETDAAQALERARSVRPDVFVLDIGMPGMSGLELARRLRTQPETANALLIALSGYAQDGDRKHSSLAGFDHHLAKPFNVEQLATLLASAKSVSTNAGNEREPGGWW